jgi:hypothetical protein
VSMLYGVRVRVYNVVFASTDWIDHWDVPLTRESSPADRKPPPRRHRRISAAGCRLPPRRKPVLLSAAQLDSGAAARGGNESVSQRSDRWYCTPPLARCVRRPVDLLEYSLPCEVIVSLSHASRRTACMHAGSPFF